MIAFLRLQQKRVQSGEFTETTLILLIAIRANPGNNQNLKGLLHCCLGTLGMLHL